MPTHPSSDDRAWLHGQLAALIARAGHERFVAGPILEPTTGTFPDRYDHGPDGVRAVARRLLAYAGRSGDRVVVHDLLPAVDGRRIETWELSVRDVGPGVVEIDLAALGRPEDLPGALSHELAVAYRELTGLDREIGDPYRSSERMNDAALEVQLGALTAVYLGWGILATNAAELVRTAGDVVGNWHTYEVASGGHGALPPVELAYLLAVQTVVRGLDPAARKHVASFLAPNQRKFFRDWVAALTPERADLVQELGLPPPANWPAPEAAAPSKLDEDEPPRKKRKQRTRRVNEGRPVFRVAQSAAVFLAIIGVVAGFLTAVLVTLLLPLSLPWSEVYVPIGLIVAGAAAGYITGSARRHDVCSDPGCERELPPDATRCGHCGGVIAGRIRHASERLAAEERLPSDWRDG